MHLYTYVLIFFALSSLCCFVWWRMAEREVNRWRILENNQVKYSRALEIQIAEIRDERERIEKFKAQPGMATVPDGFAIEFMKLQTDNRLMTTELNEMRLQAAKYMDLYRQERYKPRQKAR